MAATDEPLSLPGAKRERAATERRTRAGGGGARLLILLFLASLCLPIVFYIGPLRLAPYRLLLIALFLPLLFGWLGGRAGRVRAPDVMIALFCLFGSLSLLYHHGVAETWETAGIFAIEAMGAYLMARVLIRDAATFTTFVKYLLLVLAALIPFVAFEALTGRRVITEALSGAFATYSMAHRELRWGMHRAAGPFEHPILFGVFASPAVAMAYYVFSADRSELRGALSGLVAAVAVFFSLSLGAFVSVMVQCGLIAYDKVVPRLSRKWTLLIVGSLFAYVLIDLASNRTPITIFIGLFSFNDMASWMRIAVWDYATSALLKNPLFGIGMNEFPRPPWVTSSIDNFWLLNAVRYGLPAFGFLAAAFYLVFAGAGRAAWSDPLAQGCRKGLLIGLAGVCFALATVHVWNATFALLMFLLGSGVWMFDGDEAGEPRPRPPGRASRRGEEPLAPPPAEEAPPTGPARRPRRPTRRTWM